MIAALAPTVLGFEATIESVMRCSANSSGGMVEDVRRMVGPISFNWNRSRCSAE